MNKNLSLAALAVAVVVPSVSFAATTAVDLTTLTGAVDFSTVIPAILAVAALLVGVYVAWKAAKMVVSAVKTL
jgi:divalent metal cation (Fe/Co/Zn/Cd) transporter